jgi:hypothetical protein
MFSRHSSQAQIYRLLHFYTIIFDERQSIFGQTTTGMDDPEGKGLREEVMQDSQRFKEGDWIFRARNGYLFFSATICAPYGYIMQSNGL